MEEKNRIIFKSEPSFWKALADGTKPWDARLFDLSDDRIYRLARGKFDEPPDGRQPCYLPEEESICFLNKITGEVLEFRYRGMEFVPWAPGWCFLQLGGLFSRLEPVSQ